MGQWKYQNPMSIHLQYSLQQCRTKSCPVWLPVAIFAYGKKHGIQAMAGEFEDLMNKHKFNY